MHHEDIELSVDNPLALGQDVNAAEGGKGKPSPTEGEGAAEV